MALFRISKGNEANLPSVKKEGFAYFTIDESDFYIDTASTVTDPSTGDVTTPGTRQQLNAKRARYLKSKSKNSDGDHNLYIDDEEISLGRKPKETNHEAAYDPNAVNKAGYRSIAVGNSASAIGNYSSSFGQNTSAEGIASHAVGVGTVASGQGAFAQGIDVQAIGDYSHAEGNSTFAEAQNSHTEGKLSKAQGENAHAEGQGSVAKGKDSHAQNHYTIANGDYQTAIGKYNVADTTSAFIIGNGTATQRANILFVDWNGNLTAAGNIIASNFVGNGSGITNINAGNISTGILPVARGGTGNGSLTGNRLAWTQAGGTQITAGYHYASSAKVAINYTSAPSTTFYVKGTTAITGATSIGGVLTVTNTSASTNMTTGAVKVAGGVGVAGQVNAQSLGIYNKATVQYDENRQALRFVVA